MDAIKCIIKRAEEVAEAYEFNMSSTENYTYYNSKFSTILDATNYTKVTELEDIMYTYNDMSLNHDTHFYNIPVNTSYSSVHVPTNIYDRGSFDLIPAFPVSFILSLLFRKRSSFCHTMV